MQFKDECEPGVSYSTLKSVSGVIKVTSFDTSLCPFSVRIREVVNNEL